MQREDEEEGNQQQEQHEELDASTREYLWSLVELVESGVGDKEMLATSAFEAMEGKEVLTLNDPRAGPAVEKLMHLFAVTQITSLIRACSQNPVAICSSGSGSHLIESLLNKSLQLFESPDEHQGDEEEEKEEGKKKQVADLALRISELCNAIVSGDTTWADVAYDANGSHVIRAFLTFIDAQHVQATTAVSKPLKSTIHAMAASIISSLISAEGGLEAASKDPHSGAALSSVLETLALTPQLAAAAVSRILSVITPEIALGLACDSVGSHVIESILAASSDIGKTFATVYSRWIHGHIVQLSEDRVGNHIIQRLLSSPGCSASETTLIINELIASNKIIELLSRKDRSGVIMHAAEASLRNNADQKEFVTALKGGETTSSIDFAMKLLTPPSPTYQASRIAQAILSMKKDVSKILANGLLEMASHDIASLTISPSGSHVIEAVFTTNSLPNAIKFKLAAKLHGNLADIALYGPGSHVLEKIYKISDINGKEAMAKELADHQRDLESDFNGRFVLRTCKVQLFRDKHESWKNDASRASKKREMFADIVGINESTTSTTTTTLTTSNKQQHTTKEVNDFMSALGVKEKKEETNPIQSTTTTTTTTPNKKGEKRKSPQKQEEQEDLSKAVVNALESAGPNEGGEEKNKDNEDDEQPKKKRKKKSKAERKAAAAAAAAAAATELSNEPPKRKFSFF